MKVSVLIPNYNHAQFLEERIESVLKQTYQNIEVIILDDLSTDDSKTVIEKYRNNPKVTKIVYNETNSGSTFKQWQKGFSLATGDLIWIAESDDWCESIFLEVLVTGMQTRPGCILAYTQTYCVDVDNNIWWVTKGHKLGEYVDGITYVKNYLLKGCTIVNASMAIFKKDVLLNMPDSFTDFKFFGDWLFWIETARQGEVFISGRILNFFRRNDKAVSEKGHATGLNFIENLKIISCLKNYGIISTPRYKQLVFLRYTLFKQKSKKYSSETKKQIEKSFMAMFPSTFYAKRYLFTMYLKSLLKLRGSK
jgi:glycosyltransferase involved in cell wall biosynthesis